MKIAKWGNSLAVRLPRAVVERLALREGDEVELRPVGTGRLEVALDRRREEALARIGTQRWPLPAGYTFDREEAHARRGFSPDTDEDHDR